MKFVALTALSLTLAYAVFQKAGVDVPDWEFCLLAIGVTCASYFLLARRRAVPRFDRFTGIALAVFISIAILQIVPLPLSLVRILSPARVELLTGPSPTYLTLSTVPYATILYLLTLAGYLAVLLLIRDIAYTTPSTPWLTVWPLLIVGALEAALGIHQTYGGGLGYATGTYVNRDHFAGLLEMILPFAALYPISILQRDRQRYESPAKPALQACALFAIAALLLIAIVHSLSRMGFLVALISLFVAAVFALRLRGWLRTILVAAVIILGFFLLPTDPLRERFADFDKTDVISADTRAIIWRDTLGLIQTYPWFGCGLGGYESNFYKFKTAAPINTIDYAHNDYLQVLAEMGIFGFLAGLLFIARVTQKAIRTARQDYLAIASTAAILGMLLHSLVDFNMYVPANGLVLAWICGTSLWNRPR